MSATLDQVRSLIRQNKIRVSDHAYSELQDDGLLATEVIAGVEGAVVVEDYPTYAKGPCVLVLQRDRTGSPIHALWGIPAGAIEPAVLITCYRPDPRRWDRDFLRRA
jgi:Domain of unknown function (DUF4258)